MTVELRPYQSCRSTEGWRPVQVASESVNLDYTVMVCPWDDPTENICSCPGYTYRGHCKHQEIAQTTICGWNEGDPEIQSDHQRTTKTCPRCGGPTRWEIEVV